MALVTYQNMEELKVLLKQYASVIAHKISRTREEAFKNANGPTNRFRESFSKT